ncbi:hypothetical protein MTO96_051695 [Rhipicephalus appendiculatus]
MYFGAGRTPTSRTPYRELGVTSETGGLSGGTRMIGTRRTTSELSTGLRAHTHSHRSFICGSRFIAAAITQLGRGPIPLAPSLHRVTRTFLSLRLGIPSRHGSPRIDGARP